MGVERVNPNAVKIKNRYHKFALIFDYGERCIIDLKSLWKCVVIVPEVARFLDRSLISLQVAFTVITTHDIAAPPITPPPPFPPLQPRAGELGLSVCPQAVLWTNGGCGQDTQATDALRLP